MDKVFVSSTSQDLMPARKSILNAIRKLGMAPVAMEDFSAANDPPWELVRKKFEGVAYFVVIIAHRYGSVDADGMAFTEREYDHAVELGIPVLAFVIADGAAWRPATRDTDALTLQRLERFKHKVLRHTADRWTSAAKLPELVIAALSNAASNPRLAATPRRPQRSKRAASQGAHPAVPGRDKSAQPKLTVVIPCGGTAGSLFPLTHVMPKCLVLVENKTVLQHVLDSLMTQRESFDQVIVTTGNVKDRKDYHEAILSNIEQSGHGDLVRCMNVAARSVPDLLLKIVDVIKTDNFLMHYNDILLNRPNWQAFVAQGLDNARRGYAGTIICSAHYPLKIGVVKRDKEGCVAEFEEKPQSLPTGTLANAAVAIFATRVIKLYCQSKHDSFFVGPMSSMLRSREKIGTVEVGEWLHIQDWNTLYDIQEKRLFRPSI